MNTENKPTKVTKVNWTLSWPSALEICAKTREKNIFFLMLGVFYTNIFLDKNNCLPKKIIATKWTFQTLHGFRIIWKILATIANLATNQHTTLILETEKWLIYSDLHWFTLILPYVHLPSPKLRSECSCSIPGRGCPPRIAFTGVRVTDWRSEPLDCRGAFTTAFWAVSHKDWHSQNASISI